MIMCSNCKKRPAVVFITSVQGNEKKNEGLCLACARERKIPQVAEYMEKLGITDEEIDQLSDQMMGMLDGDSFEMGGQGIMPDFISNMFGEENSSEDKDVDSTLPDSEEKPRKKGLFGREKTEKKEKKKELKFLGSYCTNLSQKAADGQLDRIIGRDKEIARVVQILSRRTKNNPCLIGEPGVGKTAIAEGIAQRINEGDVPLNLADKKLYLLDLTALVAGTQFRGQFESRVKGLVDEVKREGNIILFIDEVHNLVGAGDSEGSMNAANILKPALSRGEVQVIGATTFGEYRKYIEKDSALERRFQPVTVTEPTIEDTVNVLLGIKKYYEDYHKVHISDYLIRVCAVLSERYITDRFLPDKAIDLMDEGCAHANIRSPEIAEYAKKIKEISVLEGMETTLSEQNEPDYQALAEVKGKLIHARDDAAQLKEKAENVQVTEEDITKVVELWTGIPASKIAETEFLKITKLENALKKRVLGQDEAVEVLTRAIKRTRVQLNKRRRPASFIFVGPTGVGKTELVKALSEELFDSTEPLIRLDMTEYMEKHSVARMIGSPPGYVGYDEAGQLTEKVRRKPYSVILFDEIEKAHPDVMNILMQILDEGHIDDAQGRNINFENTIICMTSNAGSTDKSVGVGFNRTENEISRDKAMKGLREFLRPEFISRIDEVVVFKQLTKEDFAHIAALMLDEMKEPLAEKNISVSYDDQALKLIAEKSFGKPYGARDIRRVIRQDVEDKVAEMIITNSSNIDEISISVDGDNITVSGKKKEQTEE
ncbi:MAG: ATP-dependent Clp protease ATP-binding subunit [Ruminococcus sp.]|uniref:ATP-dependent Clp protease ATP-binding subunit n=1 Tax=Ruminococcus sp. TaxID=41978 RepID=UPI001B068555|nr:ATP-dependent Clp protease ATP-binding subunit [Ruminococcus sp.]MBO7472436.1 ATP-dependent Clp protease ATP-binding subunit [Ruminococcus sp.]MBP5363459.1 ATP-dependent Clp protease ATP-binding subunit [Ruminococcus sp.]